MAAQQIRLEFLGTKEFQYQQLFDFPSRYNQNQSLIISSNLFADLSVSLL